MGPSSKKILITACAPDLSIPAIVRSGDSSPPRSYAWGPVGSHENWPQNLLPCTDLKTTVSIVHDSSHVMSSRDSPSTLFAEASLV